MTQIRNKITGEILEDVKFIDTSLTTIEINYLDDGVLRIETEKDFHSFLQNWEDYNTAEPLIKDEKIRKAVRAWAEANDLEEFIVQNEHMNNCKIIGRKANRHSKIEFLTTLANAKNHAYTIAELCGDEE